MSSLAGKKTPVQHWCFTKMIQKNLKTKYLNKIVYIEVNHSISIKENFEDLFISWRGESLVEGSGAVINFVPEIYTLKTVKVQNLTILGTPEKSIKSVISLYSIAKVSEHLVMQCLEYHSFLFSFFIAVF